MPAPVFTPLDPSLTPLEESAPPTPSGDVSALGFAALAGASVLAALVVGVAWHFFGTIIDLVVVTSLLAGLALGAALLFAVRVTKCRNRTAALVCALVAAPLAFGVRTVADAFALRPAMVRGATRQMALRSKVTPEQARRGAEAYLTPAQTMRVYTRYLSENGVRLGGKSAERYDYGSDSDLAATEVTGGVFWLLTVFELVAAITIAGFIAVRAASQPFFEGSGEWGKRYPLIRKHPDHAYQLGELVRARRWADAARLPSTPAPDIRNRADVVLIKGERSGQATISIKLTEDGRSRDWFHAVLPDGEAEEAQRTIGEKNATKAARHRHARQDFREKNRKK